MFDSLRNNLSKEQKIGIFAGLQFFIIIIVIFLFNIKPSEIKEAAKLDYNGGTLSLDDVPEEKQVEIRSGVFNFLANRFPNKNINNIKITVRENSINKSVDKSNNKIRFLIDVDELKQTYAVEYLWRKDKTVLPDPLTVSCPKKSDMKYQETFCESGYNNTSSPELYLPYSFKDAGTKGNFDISYEKGKIKAFITVCGEENQNSYRQKVDDYLNSTPIDFNKYPVEYQVECYSR